MPFWQRFIDRLTGRADRDLARELRDHLDLEAEEQQQSGLPSDEAHRAGRHTRRQSHRPTAPTARKYKIPPTPVLS